MRKRIGVFLWCLLIVGGCTPSKTLSLEELKKMKETPHREALKNPAKVIKLDLLGMRRFDVMNTGSMVFSRMHQFKNAQYLSLAHCSIGEIPTKVFELNKLRWLNLKDNRLERLSDSIDKFTELQYLRLEDNRLTKLPEAIGNLQKLEHLFLDDNRIKSYPKSLGQLIHLKELSLEKCQVTTLPESFANLTALKKICLNWNSSIESDQVFGVLAKLPQLETLKYERCNVGVLPQVVTKFKSLKYIELFDTQLNATHALALLSKLPTLEEAHIYGSCELFTEEVGPFKALKTLSLSASVPIDAQVCQELFMYLAKVPKLERLGVSSKDQMGQVPKQVGQLRQLKTLVLASNGLTRLPEEIKNLKKLQLLDVSNNSFSDEEKARIKKLLPNTEIKF